MNSYFNLIDTKSLQAKLESGDFPFSQYLFWDAASENIDLKTNCRYIIERVLTRGFLEDFYLLVHLYTPNEIKEALRKSKEIDPKTAHFCCRYFNLPISEIMYHLTTVSGETYSLLREIFKIGIVKSHFALAGGTSLALQIGHRYSIDLDIFSTSVFNPKEIEIILSDHKGFTFTYSGNNSRMLFCYINNIKCDFVQEPAKLLQPFIEHDGVKYFSIQDIAAMKMHSICGRGKKKYFFDIYALLQSYSWKEMLSWFGRKYGENQFYFLWKSIGYFTDADTDADINGIPPFTKNWDEIKKYIIQHCTA